MKGTRSLARLRNRVDLTVRELQRLQNENKKIRRKLDRAANQPLMDAEGTPVIFTESGPELRSRIESCIKAIDAHLNGEQVDAEQMGPKQVAAEQMGPKQVDQKQMTEGQEV